MAHKILLNQRISDSRQNSRGARELVLKLIDFTMGMTRDELMRFMLESMAPALQQAMDDRDASQQKVAEMSRELEEEKDARKKAEKSTADKDREIAALKKALDDERNKNKTHVRNTFGSSSRRSRTASGGGVDNTDRTQEKNDFDGTRTNSQSEATDIVNIIGEGEKPITDDMVDAYNARNGMTYTMADASKKIRYACDRSAIPEGWEIASEKPVFKILFDAEVVVTAREIEFVRVRKWTLKTNRKTGEQHLGWVYRTMHFPHAGETLKRDLGLGDSVKDTENEPFDIANTPGMMAGTSMAPGMAVHMMMQNFLCFTPVNRICQVLKEYGFKKGRSGATNWIHSIAEMCRPLYDRLKDRVFTDNAVLFMDETWFRLHLTTGDRKVYEWVIGNKKEKCMLYHYDDGSRGRKVIEHLLDGRKIKAIHTDGYNAYFFLGGLGIVHVACTAHIWRYIMDWYNATQSEDARKLLAQISALYAIEAEIRGKSPEEILERRQSEEVTGILTNYKAQLDLLELRLDSLPGIGQTAVNYALKMYPKMARWREDADYEIDNNFAERSARPVAMARKMQKHHASHKGAEAACIVRSLVETCKLWGVSVYEYLLKICRAFALGSTDYDNLMPWCMESPC